MKLYKRIFLYFLRLRPRKARISRYLRFHILVTRYSIGIRRNRNSFPLHIKIDFESQFFFSISFLFFRILFLFLHPCNRERVGKERLLFFIFPLKDRLSLKQESWNNAEFQSLFLQYKKNKLNQIHGFTTTPVVTPQIKKQNFYLRDH